MVSCRVSYTGAYGVSTFGWGTLEGEVLGHGISGSRLVGRWQRLQINGASFTLQDHQGFGF